MSKSYRSCRRYKNVKAAAETSENVGNFYIARARVDRTDEQVYRSRMNYYGNTPPHGIVGQLPLPLTGMIRF